MMTPSLLGNTPRHANVSGCTRGIMPRTILGRTDEHPLVAFGLRDGLPMLRRLCASIKWQWSCTSMAWLARMLAWDHLKLLRFENCRTWVRTSSALTLTTSKVTSCHWQGKGQRIVALLRRSDACWSCSRRHIPPAMRGPVGAAWEAGRSRSPWMKIRSARHRSYLLPLLGGFSLQPSLGMARLQSQPSPLPLPPCLHLQCRRCTPSGRKKRLRSHRWHHLPCQKCIPYGTTVVMRRPPTARMVPARFLLGPLEGPD
mmetsp:Transcript_7282/g.15925  ORF Transcript_7282/g.15925 Transcript_7282/m.15925 type:complete len:257 (-) Transcript_7282:1332-2102(-)